MHLLIWLAIRVGLGLAFGLFVWQWLANNATTVFLHRCFAHGAVTLRAPARLYYRVVIWTTTGIRPGEWVAEHRVHHLNEDKPDDPHSPYYAGLGEVVWKNGKLYRDWLDAHPDARMKFPDTRPDRLDVALFDKSGLGLAVGISLMAITTLILSFALTDMGWVELVLSTAIITTVGSVGHAFAYLVGGGCVNGVCHMKNRFMGYRRYLASKASNVWWVALLTTGEGLHNNHHGNERSARLWRTWYELPLDIGWWSNILPLKLLGLAKERKVKPSVTKPLAA